MKQLKAAIRRIAGNTLMGAFDYYRFPDRRNGFGGPFNNQSFRRKLFLDVVRAFKPLALIETGSHRGTTTEFMHLSTMLPVYTTELDSRYYGHSAARFLFNRQVRVYKRDSRAFLIEMAKRRFLSSERVLIYLDAHWGFDLPLKEEVEIVFSRFRHPVVLIDDFQVCGDDHYGYDDYGDGKALTLEYLQGQVEALKLTPFFPALPGLDEDGARRGCIVLVGKEDEACIRMLQTLRPAFIPPAKKEC